MKRILSLLLAVTMLVSGLPVQAFATVDTTAPTETVVVETTAAEETTVPEETDPSVPETTEVSATEPSVPETTEETVVETTEAVMESTEATEETVAEEEIGFFALRGSAENFSGKVISIMGDSISTFAGYIPTADGFNLEHLARYPQADLLTDVNETWWMQVITALDAKLGINDSWRGATLSGGAPVTTGTTGENAAMSNLVRIQNLGANGTPDIILLYGGTNDLAHVSKVGSFNANTAPSTVDLTTAKWDNLADGLVHTILRMRHYYPNAQIVALLPAVTASYYSNEKLAEGNAVMAQICEHYGVPYADLRECGITTADLPDGIHPDAAGMDYITEAVLDVLLSQCEMEAGENKVYSVSHLLTGAKADKHYYKGISAGAKFEETISGEDLTVTVTMGGVDITSSAYADGRISIANVTGDIVVTAKAVFSLGDRLLQLPEKLCAGLNLWTALEHDKEYYTASGWGVHGSGKVYSVTIPVKAGDRLWATSFQSSALNGSPSSNGIRVTYFSEDGMLDSLTSTEVYNELTQNGYLTVPEQANAVNIPMWTNEDSNELYLLNAEHSYENCKCTICGAQQETAEALSLRYDDHYDISGKSVEIVDGDAIVTVDGNYLVASGIGTAMVRIDGQLYEVAVEKAKLNLVVIMGQSNAGNHFENATSDVTCPVGTAYWWGNGKGTAATEPVPYTQPSMGFHTPLLAELYAQSVAAGDPVKNVMIWHEGITSKNGQSIVKWATSAEDTSGTDATVAMIENCRAYYAEHADKYEIVGSGVYWLQGESDLSMDPELYTQRFMAMWQRLKRAGMDYLAFFRVRKAVSSQPEDRNDLDYSASLSAQIRMINEKPEFYMATDLTENWVGTQDVSHTVDISNYITMMQTYGGKASHTDAYGNNATYADGKLTTTMKSLYGSNNKCHYGKFGYGLIGADAAYNMYRALHEKNVEIVVTDTSGHASRAQHLKSGAKVTIDTTDMTDNLSFRAACGSTAGTLQFTVKSGETDITENVIAATGLLYNSVSVEAMRNYKDVSIDVVYTTSEGTVHSVTCNIRDEKQEASEALSLRYDDHYDISGKTVEIVDAGKPTSYQVGYGVAEGTLDTAVVTVKGDHLVATGIGTAKVRIDGQLYEVTVTAAPLSVFLLMGQSNMAGNDGNKGQSIAVENGQAYSTFTGNTNLTVETAPSYIPSALTGQYSTINTVGTTEYLSEYPVNSIVEAGDGKIGMDGAIAYRWNQMTGDKVWTINVAHAGSAINSWLSGKANYNEAVAAFKAVKGTLEAELAAGHYILKDYGYFWNQGCADTTRTAKQYAMDYIAMHEAVKAAMTLDHDDNSTTAEIPLQFGAIIPIRSGRSYESKYRAGTYTVEAVGDYYTNFMDMQMSGPRAAQFWMGNNPELEDIFVVWGMGEEWVYMPDGSDGVAEYFAEHYENGTVDYPIQTAQAASWYKPTKPADIHNSIHYRQIGYNELGLNAAMNLAYTLGRVDAPDTGMDVKLYSWDGINEVTQVTANILGESQTLIVPVCTPIYRSKEVSVNLSKGLSFDYYDLIADSIAVSGTLTVTGANHSVEVVKGQLNTYRWEFDGTDLISVTTEDSQENMLVKTQGTTVDGVFSDVRYQLDKSMMLLHSEPWRLEWKCSGTWKSSSNSGGMMLTGNTSGGEQYLFKSSSGWLLAFGELNSGTYYNYGIALKDHGIDGSEEHTYRLQNRIAADGSNMVWLYVDGKEIGPMNNLFVGTTSKGTTSDWISGKDFIFPYIGASGGFSLNNCSIDYIAVWEAGKTEKEPAWESGTIDSKTGLNKANTTRLRTVDYLNLSDYSGVSIASGYTMTNFVYDENGNYLGTSDFLGNGYGFTTKELMEKYPTGVTFRIALRTMDQTTLTVEDIAASGVTFHAVGEEVPEPEIDVTVENLMTVGSWQEGAIFDHKLFLLGANGTGVVYALDTQEKLGSLTLENADIIKPHANSVCFGTEFCAPEDEFPLLYVNVYNNYANAEDRMEGVCCVYRIVWNGDSYVGDLVQILEIGFTEDLNLWKSKENNGDVRPYGNFVVDTDNDKLYAYVMRDADKTTRFFRFALPERNAGEYSATVDCNVVTLYEQDIENQFDTDYFNYLQGADYGNGKIVSAEGISSGNYALRIVDLETQAVQSTYDLTLAGINSEPEVVCVDPDGNAIYYAAADGVLRKLTLPDWEETTPVKSFSGKTFSILGDSISTFAGVSNNTSFNSTIGNNELYYTEGRQNVYLEDTWWQQVMDALDMNLCVNNSWSGSTVFHPRKGVGSEGYVSRCVQLHSDQNPESPADPDVIAVFLGTNDFSYYQSTLGTADIDYDAIITDNGDGTFAYAEPATSCEAYAIMLHKMQQRYPDAQVYCMLMLPRRGNATQPTAFNAELTEVIEHFGYTAVDLENCGITPEPEIFDVYITDKRVHPGPLGMNRIAEAVVSTMLGKKTDIHRVKWTGDAYYVQVGDITWKDSVLTGERITTTFQPEPGFEITSITVTVGGEDISRWTVNGNTVTIDSVTGDVEVAIETAVEKREPLNFRWESIGADLFETENANNTKNKLTKLGGTASNGVLSNTYYKIETPVQLRHDMAWVVEWSCGGDWSGMLLSAEGTSGIEGNTYLFRSNQNTDFLGFGERRGGNYHNYGIALADYGIKTDEYHYYRLENRWDYEKETNMVYLMVDGVELGAMNNYFIGGTSDQNKTVDWVSGKDFVFSYMGTDGHALNNMKPDFVQVWERAHIHTYESVVTKPTCTEKGYTTHTCTVCGDSYVDSYVDVVWHSYEEGCCSMCGCDMIRISRDDITMYQGGVNSENGTLNTTFTNNWYTNIRIPIGAEQVHVLTFKTGGNWGSAFLKGADYLSGFCDKEVGGQWITVDVPNEANVFRYGYLYDEIAQKNNLPTFQYLEFAGEKLETPEDSGYMDRPGTGCHSFSVEVNIAPAMGKDGYVKGTDYGYIQLPTNYSPYGDPTRLIIVCHGAGADISTYQSDDWKNTNYSFWTDLGYAVMDMYACPPELTGNDDSLHYGNPVVLECYMKGYEYVLEKFNLKQDGIFLIGASMGGLSSFQIAQSEQFPVIAQVGYCPAIDLFKQAYCNPWTTASYQRSRIASYFGFAGTAPTFTNSKYPSAAEIEYYQQNFDKTIAYSPILRNVVDGDVESIFDVIPSSATAADAAEAAIYAQLTATHPNPLMIFHNTDDSTVSYRYSQYLVDMLNRSGQDAQLRTFTSGGHNAWANGANVSVQSINGNITLKESQYEAYLFFEKFEKHEQHQSWVDPAVKPTCTETGLTEGKHCAVCGEILVAQTTVAATGHRYESVITQPTCTEKGYTTHTCACGDSYVDSYVDPVGHAWGNWVELAAPACDTEGNDQRICAECGDKQYRDTRITGDPNKLLVSNPVDEDYFSGKKLLLIGDSITCGVGVSDRSTEVYGQIVGKELGMSVTNKGVSGSGYCSGGAMSTNKTLTEANVRNADVVTIMLGTNDWTWAVKDGSWNGKPEYYDKSQTYYQLGDFDSTDTSTLYGALHSWCQNIIALKQMPGFENKQFVVITPLITSWNTSIGQKDWNQDKVNIHGHTFREHCTAIMEVCAYYDIPVFDANMFSGIYYKSAKDNNVAETGGDGVHVNAAGHALLAEALEEFLLEGYSYETRSVKDGGHTYVEGICEDCRLPYACEHTYESVVTKPTCTEKGYTTHTCTVCGDSYVDSYTDPRPLNVLMIGNSFTWDAADAGYGLEQSQMYDVITAMLADGCSVELGVVVRGSTKLSYHYAHIEDATDYKYSQITAENGKWNPATPAANTSISKVLDSKDWDIVVLQSYREEMTGGNDVKTSLQNLLDYLAEHEEGAEVYYYMPWAATDVSEGDTLAKYKEIAAFTDANVMEIRGAVSGNTFAGVIPVGTGIQNARGTYLNELHYSNTEAGANPNIDSQRGLERDKQHVSFGIGRYIAGVIVAESLIPEELRKDSYSWPTIKDSPAVGAMPAEYNEIAQKAIEGALKTPYALTAISGYEEDPCSTMVSAIAKKDFDLTGVTNEAQLKAAITEQVKAMLTKEGFAEPIVTVKDSKFVDGKLSTCQATVTLRFGYTTKVAEIVKHTHTYESVVTKPTCTEKGYTTHTCACGDSYVDSYVDALGHSFGDWETTIAATCTEKGEERRDCENCDHYETRETASKGHTEVIDKAVESTCTETGLTEGKHCSVCEAVLVKQNVVPAKGHSYGDWTETKAATCTETGEERRDCTNCDHFETRETAVKGHTEVIDKAVEATCTETGLTEGKHCSVCETVLVKQNVVPAKGHSFGNWTESKAATCTETGEKRRDCANCDHFETREIAAKGHTEVVDKAVEPTCTETGLTEGKHCSVCETVLVKQNVVPAKGHSYEPVVTKPTCTEKGYTTHTCTACGDSYVDGETAALGHIEVIDKAVEATCTETGLTEGKHCSVCNTVLVKQNVVPAKGHSYESVVTKPTCTEKGYTTHTCTACGDSYVDSETAALGHKWDDGKVTREPTETVQGEKVYTCTVCGETRIEILPVLGHEHSYTSVVTKPTCTDKGYTTYTCNCGHSYIDNEVPALGHTEVIDKAVEATCTETGLTEGKHCSVCETVLVKQNVVPAKGHSYEPVVTKPTCTEKGYTTHTCTACGDSYVDSETAALGHKWDDGKVTREPTETVQGEKVYTCTVCGETRIEILPVLGHEHSYTSVETKPTCTEKGYTTYTCNCGHSYIDNEVPALGHTEVIDKAVEATCTGTGLTEGKHCSVCETVLVKQNVVPAKGHSFGSWVESTAPTCTESGEQKRECACGHVESRSVDALGHEEVVDEGVKPTCTEGGISDGKHCSRCGEILKAQENLPATGHSYGEKPELHWNEERTSCKIHFLCGDCDAIKVLTRPVLKEIDDENGEIVYTVTFQFGGKTYTETIREAIADPDEHRYDTDPKFFWSENNTSCKAYFHCSHCDGIKVKVCTVTSETDTENKKILHTATVEFEGKTFTDVREEVLKDILWGDANGDGRVNAMDATRILRYAAKLVAADQIDLTVSDVNDDGKVNAMDATRILRYAAKLITELRTEKLA